MGTNQTIAAITALAAAIADGRSADEIAWIGVVMTQLADTLATIAAQKSRCESPAERKSSEA